MCRIVIENGTVSTAFAADNGTSAHATMLATAIAHRVARRCSVLVGVGVTPNLVIVIPAPSFLGAAAGRAGDRPCASTAPQLIHPPVGWHPRRSVGRGGARLTNSDGL